MCEIAKIELDDDEREFLLDSLSSLEHRIDTKEAVRMLFSANNKIAFDVFKYGAEIFVKNQMCDYHSITILENILVFKNKFLDVCYQAGIIGRINSRLDKRSGYVVLVKTMEQLENVFEIILNRCDNCETYLPAQEQQPAHSLSFAGNTVFGKILSEKGSNFWYPSIKYNYAFSSKIKAGGGLGVVGL